MSCSVHVSISDFFTIRQNGFVVGARTLTSTSRKGAGKVQGRMEGGREVARGRGGSDDVRQGESVSGGRLREGGLMKGRNEVWTARCKDGREGASGGGIE